MGYSAINCIYWKDRKCNCVKRRLFFGKFQNKTCKIIVNPNAICEYQIEHKMPNLSTLFMKKNKDEIIFKKDYII